MALAQVRLVREALAKKFPELQTEIVVIKTSGDWAPSDGETPLAEAQGGKGLFAKEIEEALLEGSIDCAVHSMKDMDSHLPHGLCIEHMLPREDPRDCLILNKALAKHIKRGAQDDLSSILKALPSNVRIGTSSVRRAAFLQNMHPDIKIVPLRGNVQTRIDKLEAGQVDVTLLAMAGLNRLGLGARADVILSAGAMLPSAGQGAVGLEMREKDTAMADMFAAISCRETVLRVKAERAVLRVLDGSCRTPIAAFAEFNGNILHLRGSIAEINGTQRIANEILGVVTTQAAAEALGEALGRLLKV